MNEMDCACGTNGKVKSWIQGFGRERDHFEELGVDGRLISNWIFNK
jgi:hypothetical protein